MSEGKLITILQHRQEIEATLRQLAQVRTEEESRTALRALAGHGSGVLPVLVRHLDTTDPWMVRALGRAVAQLDDRPRAADALRRAILELGSSDRRRIVAMVLLDQFLGQPLDDALFSALGNPAEVSVRALLRETPLEERVVRLDYLSILHAQPLPEIYAALERFRKEGSATAVEALRFFALDEREAIARAAVEALGTIRRPDSLHALAVVEPNVPPFRLPLVKRMRRKLLLGGVVDAPLPDPPGGTRVLVSPLDGVGNRLLLILFPQEDHWSILNVFLNDELGVQGTYEVAAPRDQIAPVAPQGTALEAPHPWEGVYLLETGFSYAHSILREALSYNQIPGQPYPLEYRFYCDLVWGWSVPPETPPPPPGPARYLSQQSVSTLLGHSYLVSWFLDSDMIQVQAQQLASVDLAHQEGQGALVLATVSLVQPEFSPAVCARYVRRLRDTAGWLARAGEVELAAIAAAAEEELSSGEPLRSIFALTLVQKGLLVALAHLRQGAGRGRIVGFTQPTVQE